MEKLLLAQIKRERRRRRRIQNRYRSVRENHIAEPRPCLSDSVVVAASSSSSSVGLGRDSNNRRTNSTDYEEYQSYIA